ncbi:MAG: LamG domain-containing protein [Chitinophagaceae bacterium]|nr:LamG domain-containing protein [Chitinophagaceae bacterium]
MATVTVTPSTGGGGGGGLIPEVLYYKFDGSGTTVPNLASAPPGGTATATLMGGLTQGGSAICDGTSIGTGAASTTDYLNTGWAPNLGTGSWTISFKSENITPSATLFYVFGDVNSNNFRCFTNGVAGANNWWLRGAGLTDVPLNGGATVAPHTNTFVYDAVLNQVRAYLDGVLVNTVAQGAPNVTGAGPFKVNGYSANVGSPANGHYDEFKVFSRALTPAEVLSLNGCPALGPTCTGTPRTFTYTVNPTPTVDPVANQAVCNNSPTAAVNFTGFVPGTVYSWTNSDPSIGLAASGTGNIASFTATNAGPAPVTATITVTPSYTNAGVTCTGTPITFTITVNPTGQVDQPASQVVCNNTATAPVNFTTTVPGTIFDWVNNTPSIGLAASGTGDIASFTATNATNAPVVATVTVTPSYVPAVSGSQTFNFTGGLQTFIVPAGVTSVFLQTWGGQGGSGATGGSGTTGGSGGLGGYAEGNLAVVPGQLLNIFVGGQGATPAGGFNGGANGGSSNAGGGGGASDVRTGGTAEVNRVITAGGGGGGGRAGCETAGAGVGGSGGTGGGGIGANGGDSPTSGGVAGGGRGGNFGGIQGAFGAAGIGCAGFLGAPGATAATGSGASGGAGQSCCCFSFGSIPGGGGGGGGQVGGGGGGGGSAGTTGCSGNDKGAGGGGGGGSSFIGGVTGGVTNPGIWLGNGQVTVSWAVPAGAPCPGPTKTFTITVNPMAQVDQPADQVVCNNTAFLPTNFTSPTTGGTITYAWTNNNTTVGLGASGTGNIPAFVGTNATNAPNVATVTVTPSITTPAPAVPVSATFNYTGRCKPGRFLRA